jgi:hypothetical protein
VLSLYWEITGNDSPILIVVRERTCPLSASMTPLAATP